MSQRVIYKYPLSTTESITKITTIVGPVVHAGPDPQNQLCVWIEGDPSYVGDRTFQIVMTGQKFGGGRHLTSFMQGGRSSLTSTRPRSPSRPRPGPTETSCSTPSRTPSTRASRRTSATPA